MRKIAISDPHGRFSEMVKLLKLIKYDPSSDELYLLGDYVDRGQDSLKTLRLAMELSLNPRAAVIGGNHDDMFLNWLDGRDDPDSPYTNKINGGETTITSFCPFYRSGVNEEKARSFIKNNFLEEIEFLRNLPYYAEDDDHIYVHAGVDMSKKDWKQTSKYDFRWIRETFYFNEARLDKPIVFGHTPCGMIRGQEDPSVWFSPCGGKIGIDGGLFPGEQLNALAIEKGGYSCMHVKNIF